MSRLRHTGALRRPQLLPDERQAIFTPGHSGIAYLVPGVTDVTGHTEVFARMAGCWSAEDLLNAAASIRRVERRMRRKRRRAA